MAPWQPGLASQRQPQPSPDKLSHADPAFGGPRTQRALGAVSRESSGCRYGHGCIGCDTDRQLRLSRRGGITASLRTQSFNLHFPPPLVVLLLSLKLVYSKTFFFALLQETRHPCQASELAGSAIETMRPISMGRNDLLHGQPQYEYDNRLHAPALATTTSNSSSSMYD